MEQESGDDARRSRAAWEARVKERPLRTGASFTTVSGEPVALLYTPDDIRELNYLSDLGYPGDFPYTRGIHATMYREKLWTMRQFAGFGTPEDTNAR